MRGGCQREKSLRGLDDPEKKGEHRMGKPSELSSHRRCHPGAGGRGHRGLQAAPRGRPGGARGGVGAGPALTRRVYSGHARGGEGRTLRGRGRAVVCVDALKQRPRPGRRGCAAADGCR